MTCEDKVFINSHTVFPLNILSGFTVSDIVELVVTLELGSESIEKKLSTGGVSIVSSEVFLEIEAADITVPGTYSMTVILTDTNGDVSTINNCPATLKFHQ